MGDLTLDFSRHEFACKCGCGFDTINLKTVDICQTLRNHFKRKITITSGCRCSKHNAEVGGSRRSQHLQGTAADVVVDEVDAQEVYDYLELYSRELGLGGLGYYDSFTHLDVRQGRARW